MWLVSLGRGHPPTGMCRRLPLVTPLATPLATPLNTPLNTPGAHRRIGLQDHPQCAARLGRQLQPAGRRQVQRRALGPAFSLRRNQQRAAHRRATQRLLHRPERILPAFGAQQHQPRRRQPPGGQAGRPGLPFRSSAADPQHRPGRSPQHHGGEGRTAAWLRRQHLMQRGAGHARHAGADLDAVLGPGCAAAFHPRHAGAQCRQYSGLVHGVIVGRGGGGEHHGPPS